MTGLPIHPPVPTDWHPETAQRRHLLGLLSAARGALRQAALERGHSGPETAVPGVGATHQVLQEAAALPDPQIFRGQNSAVLLLARLLHKDARDSVHCWHALLLVRPRNNGQRVQYAQQGDLRLRRHRQHNPLPTVRQGVLLPEAQVPIQPSCTTVPLSRCGIPSGWNVNCFSCGRHKVCTVEIVVYRIRVRE